MNITTGAPITEVTALIASSVGENRVRAIRSQNVQNTAPPRKVAGITMMGRDVPSSFFTRNGTAIPTNDIGPANAVTQAERMLEQRISTTLNVCTFTPTLFAYVSPI